MLLGPIVMMELFRLKAFTILVTAILKKALGYVLTGLRRFFLKYLILYLETFVVTKTLLCHHVLSRDVRILERQILPYHP